MNFKRVTVKKDERGLLLRNGDFVRVLQPGTHWLFGGLDLLTVETFKLEQTAFVHGVAEYLMAKEPEVVAAEFVRANLTEEQVGLRTENGVLVEVLPPATRRLYWKGQVDVKVEVIDLVASAQVQPAVVHRITQTQLRQRAVVGLNGVLQVQVPQYGAAVLWVDGKVERLLEPGSYAFWKFNRTIQVRHVDMRLQTLEVSGQEILSKDKVSLRLNLTASYRVTEPERAFTALTDPTDYLYKELQFGLRESVGTKTLDEILASKEELGQSIDRQVQERVAAYGLHVSSIGVKDIILPGEMKTLLNQVVEAEKQAQANLIRRREETAATRSLHNTAKMLERSPTLLRLKELEALEKVTEKIDKLTVFGGLDGLLHQLVKLRDGD